MGEFIDMVMKLVSFFGALDVAGLAAAAGGAFFLFPFLLFFELRRQLGRWMGMSGYPQAVLRIGYGPEAGATPRRPVEDVLV